MPLAWNWLSTELKLVHSTASSKTSEYYLNPVNYKKCWKVFRIGTVRCNWPMSAHASQTFSIAHCTDSEDLPKCLINDCKCALVLTVSNEPQMYAVIANVTSYQVKADQNSSPRVSIYDAKSQTLTRFKKG